MKLKTVLLIGTILYFNSGIFSQQIYMPRDITKAYEKGTRSYDGKPGKNYWQNHAKYNIAISANPPDRRISGSEEILYTNESPDTLEKIAIKIILNSHVPGAIRFEPADENYMTKGVSIDSFSINGLQKKWENQSIPLTTQNVSLAKPLLPNETLRLHFNIS